MRHLRSALFIVVSLLVLGGFTHEMWGRIVAHEHGTADASGCGGHHEQHGGQDSDAGENGCDHQGCHHGYAMNVAAAGVVCLRECLQTGVVESRAAWVPDVAPRGIEYPPQLA